MLITVRNGTKTRRFQANTQAQISAYLVRLNAETDGTWILIGIERI